MMFSTSFIGVYSFVRGFSIIIGGYYNEFTLAAMFKSGLISSIDGWFYVYIALIFLLEMIAFSL